MRSCRVWRFLAVALIVFEIVGASTDDHKHEQNVGTVLFDKSESFQHCWTAEDFLVLNSRRMLQDLLPKVKVLNYGDDHYIDLLMDYFHICLASVHKLSIGKARHLVLKALADTMGGYLQVYILPLTRQSYYAGNIKYQNAKRLFELFDELKTFLNTNGAGWLEPEKPKALKIPPIVITPSKTPLACNGLITYGSNSENSRAKKSWNSKRRKRRHVKKQDYTNGDHNAYNNKFRANRTIIIPLPYLDDEIQPNSVILPFKRNGLLSLYSEKSTFVIVKYYVASVKCIMSRTKAKQEIEMFNRDLFAWLQLSVRPHLDSDKWYPAFGGILRVFATLESLGINNRTVMSAKAEKSDLTHIIEQKHAVPTVEGVPLWFKGTGNNGDGVTFGTIELISIAVVSALLVWLLVGLSLVCYRFLMRNSDECQPCKPKNCPVAVLYKNKEYCEPKTCPSERKREQRRVLKNFRSWWRNRFTKCPGKCENRLVEEERYLASINYVSKGAIIPTTNSKACQKRKCSKSTTATPIASSKDRVSYRHRVCYSTDGSLSTNSDSPVRPR